ncbi:methylmalonate-semialdehyde dehydrogenase [acylating], mitochondrial-like [Phragmites australis]|uniref:methylmalonate-semialdehyde dehydrogenase [acylating], mitochondrial-like n=1 Tax=Phragmites australis TaxID=29695 RepID=UPI002D792489|nr:methylmalonate-semialdehyde dehydrogenase [acylating], mitochondrial-like [Phragmites australis]
MQVAVYICEECGFEIYQAELSKGESNASSGASIFLKFQEATQEVVSWIWLTTADEFRAAVDTAKTAFPGWRSTPVTMRQHIMFKFQELIHNCFLPQKK